MALLNTVVVAGHIHHRGHPRRSVGKRREGDMVLFGEPEAGERSHFVAAGLQARDAGHEPPPKSGAVEPRPVTNNVDALVTAAETLGPGDGDRGHEILNEVVELPVGKGRDVAEDLFSSPGFRNNYYLVPNEQNSQGPA